MKFLSLDVLNDFECIGSTCSNTCCCGWDIYIDEASAKRYQNLEGEFGEKIKQNLVSIDNKTFIKLLPNRRCPFLTDDNLCEVYIHLGEEQMSEICKIYPRIHKLHGDIMFHGYTISCAEVARKILTCKSPMEFEFSENSSISNLDNLEYQKEVNWALFNTLIQSMTVSVDILQNQNFPFSSRLQLLLLFHDALQKNLEKSEDCIAILNLFSNIDYLKTKSNSLNKNDDAALSLHAKLQFFTYFLNHTPEFKNTEQISAMIQESLELLSKYNTETNFIHLQTCFETLTKTESTKYENYAVYFLWRFYMDSMKNSNPKKYIILLCYLYTLHCCFGAAKMLKNQSPLTLEQQLDIFSNLARIFEHTIGNWRLDLLYTLGKNASMDEMTFLLSLLA